MHAKMSEAITIIDFYCRTNARRPVVRIDAQSKNFLRDLAGLLVRLANGEAEELQLLPSETLIFSDRVRGFALKCTSNTQRSIIRTIRHDPGKTQVIWEGPADSWEINAELLQGIIDCEKPCHQYFDEAGSDAELEIAFGEKRPAHIIGL